MTRLVRTIVPLCLALLAGCGSDEDNIDLVPVKGTINENGKPLANARVTYTPDPKNAFSTPGVDATGPEGNYLIRFKTRTGLAPGKYRVAVTPEPVVPGGAEIPDELADDPYMAQMAVGTNPDRVDKKPVKGEVSEFDAEVGEEGGIFDFDVKTVTKK